MRRLDSETEPRRGTSGEIGRDSLDEKKTNSPRMCGQKAGESVSVVDGMPQELADIGNGDEIDAGSVCAFQSWWLQCSDRFVSDIPVPTDGSIRSR